MKARAPYQNLSREELLDLFDVFEPSKNVTIIDPQHGKVVIEN